MEFHSLYDKKSNISSEIEMLLMPGYLSSPISLSNSGFSFRSWTSFNSLTRSSEITSLKACELSCCCCSTTSSMTEVNSICKGWDISGSTGYTPKPLPENDDDKVTIPTGWSRTKSASLQSQSCPESDSAFSPLFSSQYRHGQKSSYENKTTPEIDFFYGLIDEINENVNTPTALYPLPKKTASIPIKPRKKEPTDKSNSFPIYKCELKRYKPLQLPKIDSSIRRAHICRWYRDFFAKFHMLNQNPDTIGTFLSFDLTTELERLKQKNDLTDKETYLEVFIESQLDNEKNRMNIYTDFVILWFFKLKNAQELIPNLNFDNKIKYVNDVQTMLNNMTNSGQATGNFDSYFIENMCDLVKKCSDNEIEAMMYVSGLCYVNCQPLDDALFKTQLFLLLVRTANTDK